MEEPFCTNKTNEYVIFKNIIYKALPSRSLETILIYTKCFHFFSFETLENVYSETRKLKDEIR